MELTLYTDRLILRPWDINDAEDMFYGWANDPEVTKYMTWNPHQNIDETKWIINKWIEEYEDPKRLNFAIVLKENNKLIGGIDIPNYRNGIPVIGYDLSRKYWNNGYMTEACKCLINYLFSIGYNEVIIDAEVENIASNRVIEKCGGIYVNTEIRDVPLKGTKVKVNNYIIRNNK